MASIASSSGNDGKQPLDQELPLVPFIDLLFCCVMFLLATAVWNQLGRVETPLPGGDTHTVVDPEPRAPTFTLRMSEAGFSLTGSDGTTFDVPRVGARDDYTTLLEKLETLRAVAGADALVVAPDDDVTHERIILTLDTALGAGFSGVAVSPSS